MFDLELQKAKQLAENEISKQGLANWKFCFNNSKRRFGCCNFYEETIYLSSLLTELNDEHNVLDTIKHEVAHALVGPKNHHNYIWKQKAIEIGCNGERCYKAANVIIPKGNYTYECPNCKQRIEKYKQVHKDSACSACCSQYNNNKWTEKFKLKLVAVR